MARIRERVTKSCFKVEGTEGTDAFSSDDGSFFHRIIQGSTFAFNPEIITNNEFRGGLGEGEHSVGALLPTGTIIANTRASGTANLAPEVDDLLRVCGFVHTARAVLPATPSAASAGTSRTAVVPVADGWPATTAAGTDPSTGILGEAVLLAGNPATAEIDFIVDYSVTSGNATITVAGTHSPVLSSATTVQRVVQEKYSSQSPNPQPSGTWHAYLDGILQTFLGCRGSWSEDWTGRKIGTTQFDLSGFYGSRTDVAILTGETDDPASPVPWLGGICRINGRTVCATGMKASMNATGAYPTCPETTYGVDAYQVTGRGFRVTVDPDLSLVATADNVAALIAGTIMPIAFLLGKRVGGTAGTRHGIVLPQAKLRGVTPTVTDGLRKESLEFGSKAVDGECVLTFF